MSNVMCSSTDTSLDQCHFAGWGVNQCTHSTDLHIECEGIAALFSNPLPFLCVCPTHTKKCSGLAAFTVTVNYIKSFFPLSQCIRKIKPR